jgi:ribonuclease Z
MICISHFHGDHINGLPGLLGTLQLNQRTAPLVLIGPEGIKRYVRSLMRMGVIGVGYGLEIIEVTNAGIVYEHRDFTISAQRLKHRITCWGYRLVEQDRPGRFDVDAAEALGVPSGPLFGKLQRGESLTLDDGSIVTPEDVMGSPRQGRSLAYCCDTQPCKGALELASAVDLLLHEGTYAPDEGRLAHTRGHSTMADAARTARDAGSKRLIITHVSPKYIRTDGFERSVKEIFPNTQIARDLDVFELAYKT